MDISYKFPRQQLSYTAKTEAWGKKCVDFGENGSILNYDLVRQTVRHKKVNYDLLSGKLHMDDLALVLNPSGTTIDFTPETIQHFPLVNAKLHVLQGEEGKRLFDYRVIVTNPNSVSDIENTKKQELFNKLQEMVQNTSQSEEDFNADLEKLNQYFTYEWQDIRELRANCLLNHYVKEYNFPLLFNNGFMDAMTVGEEIYQCGIIGGEPTIRRLNPQKVRVFRSGFESNLENADMIVIEDYWSPGKIIDAFYEDLSPKDIKKLENTPYDTASGAVDSMDNIDERYGFKSINMVTDTFETESLFDNYTTDDSLPYDLAGNVRVLQVYWKSRRKIKKVKSYDPETGEEVFNLMPETYIIDKDRGEEEVIYWINEAWEGTKIGKDIYVNIRPCPVQYNSLANASKCHFGIIGTIYNYNDEKPFSLLDRMKPYNYLYDVVHHRLNNLMQINWGKLIQLDLAKLPKGWEINKWLYFAKANGIAVIDSFKEGNSGAAMGKLAGGLNNASSGVIDAEFGNSIHSQITLLAFIKQEMAEVAGISPQREGQVSNRETVGGVERATVQSSHITEWLFIKHEDLKRRVLECFLETAKVALKGRNKKFQYLIDGNAMRMIDIDGDEFAEHDYGLLVDNSNQSQELAQKLDVLAQAALQTQTLSFSTITKLYSSCSLAEKQKIIERDEQAIQQRNAEQQQQQLQAQQQAQQAQMQLEQQKMELQDTLNKRDNDVKMMIAQIQVAAKDMGDGIPDEMSEAERAKLEESIRQFDANYKLSEKKMDLDKAKLELESKKAEKDAELKRMAINKKTISSK